MAQYGKNYYGASYYGLSGVFAGQFLSEQINLATPLLDVAPLDGKLYVDIICAHPRITYTYPNEIYLRTGTWTTGVDSISTLSTSAVLTATLVASTIYINYESRIDGAIVDVQVKTYVDNALLATNNYSVDTTGEGPYVINPPKYGEQVISMSKAPASEASDVFEFISLTEMTTDINLEMRRKIINWAEWETVVLTATESDISYNGFGNVYKYSGSTLNWADSIEYQFRLTMASSDNSNSPEIISIDIHTTSINDYSDDGFWKMTLDLADVSTIDSIEFVCTKPEGTDIEIQSRTSDIDSNWSSWSVPYSPSTYRAMLNYKANATVTSGYIITPLVTPVNLIRWNSYEMRYFLNYMNALTKSLTPGSSIKVEVVNANYNALDPSANDVLATFSYTDTLQIQKSLSNITIPIRFKISLTRTAGIASPAVESINSSFNLLYNQDKPFGTGIGEIRAYGSAVYGDNSGIDKVYINGLTKTVPATVISLGYNLPAELTGVEYIIEIDGSFSETYTAEEVDIYWQSNGSKTITLDDVLTDDYIMVKVKEARDPKRISKNYRYGSGIATLISPGFVGVNLTNTFSPSLVATTPYAYYLQNGFTLDEPNTHLDIRWKSEDIIQLADRTDISYTLNDQIYISIITGSTLGLVEWVSEEKKFDGQVNTNDIYKPYITTLKYSEDLDASQIPEIEKDIIINSDPTILPYQVEVIEGSVMNYSERRPEGRIVGSTRYLYSTETTPSLQTAVEIMVPIVRGTGDTDRFPKAMVKQLNGTFNGNILGVYSLPTLYMPDYANKINQTTGEELVTGDYRYYTAANTYSNIIDWSPALLEENAPVEGSIYYVSYVYDKVVSLRVEFTCDYSEYEPSFQIYRSPVLEYTGECSPMTDYISSPMSFDSFSVAPDVDKSTLRYVIYDDNSRVRTYLNSNTVVGTLDMRDPRDSWNPYIKGGYYHINKDSYYMFVNENQYILGESLIPKAENIEYTNGVNSTGVLVQEGTVNLFENSALITDSSVENAFVDTFTRTV